MCIYEKIFKKCVGLCKNVQNYVCNVDKNKEKTIKFGKRKDWNCGKCLKM